MADDEAQRDEALIALILEKKEVLGILISRYDERLRRYLRRIMPGITDELDDVLQEIFIKVYVNARSFDTSLSFSSWIYRIAHNEAVSWLRKKKARPDTVELGDDDFHTFQTSMDESRGGEEHVLTKDAVARVLAHIPEKYRSVLVLHYLEGRSYEEISDIMLIPQGTVATYIHRGKKYFSTTYQEHHE